MKTRMETKLIAVLELDPDEAVLLRNILKSIEYNDVVQSKNSIMHRNLLEGLMTITGDLEMVKK